MIVPTVAMSVPINFDEAIEPASMEFRTLPAPIVVNIPVEVTSPVRFPVKVEADDVYVELPSEDHLAKLFGQDANAEPAMACAGVGNGPLERSNGACGFPHQNG